MKQGSMLFGLLLLARYVRTSPIAEFETVGNVSLARRAPATVTLDCDPKLDKKNNVRDACVNACYYINCRRGGNYVAKLDRGNSKDKRAWSGCNISRSTPGISVCYKNPFSQLLHDKQRGNKDQRLNCDEFPMALTAQLPYRDRKDKPELFNSLRCIDPDHNTNAGNSIESQIERAGLRNGDDFTFNFIHADDIPYCKNDGGGCDNTDKAQFEMTDMRLRGGKISNPYDYDKDNKYKVSGQTLDIDGLFLILVRTQSTDTRDTDITYDLEIKYRLEDEEPLASKRQTRKDASDDSPHFLEPNDNLFAPIRMAPYIGLDLEGSVFNKPMSFLHGDDGFFSWRSDTEGVDDNSALFGVGTKDKHYCKEDSGETLDTFRKDLTCYFPTLRIRHKG